jgi:glycosyltransferase involved in cell wall biosynthesis
LQHKENRGLPAARNTGIRGGSGELVAFLDADDVWSPTKLERQVPEFMACEELGLAFTSLVDCDANLLPLRGPRPFPAFRCQRVFDRLYLEGFAMPPSTVIVRRRALERCGLFDESMRKAEDFECWLRIAMIFPVSCVPEPLCLRRTNPQSITQQSSLDADIRYAFRAFDLCQRAAEHNSIHLPMSPERRKVLFLRRRYLENLRYGDMEVASYYYRRLLKFTKMDFTLLLFSIIYKLYWYMQRNIRRVSKSNLFT